MRPKAEQCRRTTLIAAMSALAGAPLLSAVSSAKSARSNDPPTFPDRKHAMAASISANVELIRIGGFSTAGDGGGALYKRAASAPRHALWFQSADGAFWEWSDVLLDVRMAGAVGDGVWDRGRNWSFSGTDDTVAIQNAINAHCYFRLADAVWFPGKAFRTTAPLHAFYGTNHVSVRLLGSGLPHPGGAGRPLILCDFSNAPGISCQGVMGFTIRGLGLVGRNFGWIAKHDLGGSEPKLDDTIASNWVDPALAANAASQTAPYAGLAIDPYLGPHEHGRYPKVELPSFLKESTSAVSSDIAIEDCYIGGFVVGVVDQPGGIEGNGDFLKLRRCFLEANQYGISIGNRESRNVLRDSVTSVRQYCLETTNTHGARRGKMHGVSLNCAVDATIHLFQFGAFHSGPLIFKSMYAEGLWRLGDFDPDPLAESSIAFEDCQFSLNGQHVNGPRGVPATVMGGYRSGHQIAVQFRNTTFFGYPSVLPLLFDSQSLTADGLYCRSNNGAVPEGNFRGVGFRSAVYQRFASNATADGLILYDGMSRTGRMRLKFAQYDVDAGRADRNNVSNRIEGPSQLSSSRNRCACTYVQRLVESAQPDGEGVWLPKSANLLEKARLSNVAISSRTVSFSLPADWRTPVSLAYRGPLPGDVIIDQGTGSVLFVRTQIAASGMVVAELQNNYVSRDRGWSYSMRMPIDFKSGNLVIVNSRLYTPTKALRADIVKGEHASSNAGCADGTNDFITNDLAVGDYLYIDIARDAPFTQEGSLVVSVNAGSLTFRGDADYTAARKRFGIFIRPGARDT